MEQKPFEHLGRDIRDSIAHLLRDYSEALGLAILMALVLRFFVISAYKVTNPTMEPNLKLGDFIVGYRLPYGITLPFTDIHLGQTTPRRGDILIFRCPEHADQSCVKRVVGLPGDRIEIRKKRLILNGRVAKYAQERGSVSDMLKAQARFAVLQEVVGGNKRTVAISAVKDPPDFGPLIVPPDTFFALGDNRDFSEDSRHWGPVPIRAIEARAFLSWLSIEWTENKDGEYHSRVRWDRLFRRLN